MSTLKGGNSEPCTTELPVVLRYYLGQPAFLLNDSDYLSVAHNWEI